MPADSLTSRVIDYIFDYIQKGGLSSGDALPSEMRTSTDVGVSRTVVREAFRSLEVAGIIDKGNGRSPRVGVLNSAFMTQLMLHALSTSQISPEDVLEVRLLLETRAAQLAARRRTEDDVARLHAAVAGMLKSVGSPDRFVQHDMDFHTVLNSVTGNPLMGVMSGSMHACMQQTMRLGIGQRKAKADVLRVVETHRLLADAIEEKDSARAAALMKRHFSEAKRALSGAGGSTAAV